MAPLHVATLTVKKELPKYEMCQILWVFITICLLSWTGLRRVMVDPGLVPNLNLVLNLDLVPPQGILDGGLAPPSSPQ